MLTENSTVLCLDFRFVVTVLGLTSPILWPELWEIQSLSLLYVVSCQLNNLMFAAQLVLRHESCFRFLLLCSSTDLNWSCFKYYFYSYELVLMDWMIRTHLRFLKKQFHNT